MLPRPAWTHSALLFLAVFAVAADPLPPSTPALALWQRGQEVMRDGDTEKAISFFQESLKLDPDLARTHLSLAAAYADRGQENLALVHLDRYVHMQPQHLVARLHYADMLLRAQQPAAARIQYERFIAEVQEHETLAEEHVVHCHSQLMEICAATGDEYAEHLNRGIGLYHLACQRAALPDPNGELSVEGLLFRAAAELMTARQHRPDEARPCWYLHEVWARLGQKQPAARWLRNAEGAALLSELTPAEKRGLHLAWNQFQQEGRK
jgi:tetratricopeptide (TPR) repeat protein